MQDNRNNGRTGLQSDVERSRTRTELTARRLTLVAIRNWEKALTGMVALPAAAALSTAAAVLFATALLERAFEMTESGVADLGQRFGDDYDAHGDPRDAAVQARPS